MEREWVPASAGRTQNIVDPVSRTGRHFFRIKFELCLFSSPDLTFPKYPHPHPRVGGDLCVLSFKSKTWEFEGKTVFERHKK